MSEASHCRLETLAQNSFSHIQRCTDCGCVSVHVGATTIRLDETGLRRLASVLGQAVFATNHDGLTSTH